MKKVYIFLITLFLLNSCSKNTRIAIRLENSEYPVETKIMLGGYYSNGSERIYFFKNNLLIRTKSDNNLKNNWQNPEGYGMYSIKQNTYTILVICRRASICNFINERVFKSKRNNRNAGRNGIY